MRDKLDGRIVEKEDHGCSKIIFHGFNSAEMYHITIRTVRASAQDGTKSVNSSNKLSTGAVKLHIVKVKKRIVKTI